MLVFTKGYTIMDLSARKAGKEGYLDALSSMCAPEELRAQILAARAGKGEVFSVTCKRALVGVIILSREAMNTADLIEAHSELSNLIGRKKQEAAETKPLDTDAAQSEILRLTGRYILPEHAEALRAIENSDDIAAELRSLMLDEKTKAIFYGDTVVIPRKVHIGKFAVSGFVLGIVLGLLFGIAMENIGVGLCFGVAFSASFGTLFSHIGSQS